MNSLLSGLKRELTDDLLNAPSLPVAPVESEPSLQQPDLRPPPSKRQRTDFEAGGASSAVVRPDPGPEVGAAEPLPGCSHWSDGQSGSSSPHQGVTSSSSVPVNWEQKYNELLTTHIALLGKLQVNTVIRRRKMN